MSNTNDLIHQLRSSIEKKIVEEKRHKEVMARINKKIKNMLSILVEAGRAFEVVPDDILKSLSRPAARFSTPREFEEILRKIGLPQKAIQKLILGAKGKDLIPYLEEADWEKIPGTDIWLYKIKKVDIHHWFNHEKYIFVSIHHGGKIVLVKSRQDKKTYLVDTETEKKLTPGFDKGELLPEGGFKMQNKGEDWVKFDADGKRIN